MWFTHCYLWYAWNTYLCIWTCDTPENLIYASDHLIHMITLWTHRNCIYTLQPVIRMILWLPALNSFYCRIGSSPAGPCKFKRPCALVCCLSLQGPKCSSGSSQAAAGGPDALLERDRPRCRLRHNQIFWRWATSFQLKAPEDRDSACVQIQAAPEGIWCISDRRWARLNYCDSLNRSANTCKCNPHACMCRYVSVL